MKYYVVWKGKQTWVFSSWNQVQPLISWFSDAKFKSFETREDAEHAFVLSREDFYGQSSLSLWKKWQNDKTIDVPFCIDAVAVDAACAWNPGILERRGVEVADGNEIFSFRIEKGTNNVGEFLAIVSWFQRIFSSDSDFFIYSDSKIAINWVKERKCKSLLRIESPSLPVWKFVQEAEEWLKTHEIDFSHLLKRRTSEWGEIPADFGRK